MNRNEFEQAAKQQNERHAQVRAEARASQKPCSVVTMFAFGGESYCSTHGVMGECPYGVSK